MADVVLLLLLINKLNWRDHVVAVWPNSMPEDGGVAVSMMALAVVLAERKKTSAHGVVILQDLS